MTLCSGCRAEILWLKTKAGKWMCLDPDPQFKWVVTDASLVQAPAKRITLQDRSGETHTGYLATEQTPDARRIAGYRPHWASCSASKLFRRATV